MEESRKNDKTDNSDKTPTAKNIDSEDGLLDANILRHCEIYKQEYKDCKSLRGRFHHYFVYGEIRHDECKQWQDDYNNCIEWKKTNDELLLAKVVQSERARQKIRVKGMVANNIWQLRKTPVTSEYWNRPLPEYLAKWYDESNSTYLQEVAKRDAAAAEARAKQESSTLNALSKQNCTIL